MFLVSKGIHGLNKSTEFDILCLNISHFSIVFSDTNCVFLVSEGVHDIMLQVLDVTESHGDKNPGLQHAVFSSLRNLSIPGQLRQVTRLKNTSVYMREVQSHQRHE